MRRMVLCSRLLFIVVPPRVGRLVSAPTHTDGVSAAGPGYAEFLTNTVVAARFLPIWLATGVLALVLAILACVGLGALVGFTNGIFVGVLKLNPLIVTLATGQIVLAWGLKYSRDVASGENVPSALSSWASEKPLGISSVFWTGAAVTVAVALVLRYTAAGRRFQTVGANPRAAWMAGVHVRTHVVFAYTIAATLYAGAAVLLAGVRISIDPGFGAAYLLAPIAAVVIAGASLAGGLASATSTWVAALALTLLTQMLGIFGLSTAMQYVVFGAAIIVGMMISGDRVASLLGRVLRPSEARAGARLETNTS